MNDALLFKWYSSMLNTNELESTMMPADLSSFMLFFRPPQALFFKAESNSIWFAAWFSPLLNSAAFGIWVDKQHRSSKSALKAGEEILEFGLKHNKVLVGVTAQEKLLDGHRRMGYTVLGEIPGLHTKKVWVVYLTREGFINREMRLYMRSKREEVKEAG